MLKKLICTVLSIAFLTTGAYAQPVTVNVLGLPEPGRMVQLSPAYQPVMLQGVTVNKDNPFLFDFLVDAGQDGVSGEALKAESDRLIKYFLATLAIPEADLWVNLSPYEKDRTVTDSLGQTDMGRDLLAQDYILKQLTASLIYPEKELGKKFWDKIYSQINAKYGNVNIPVNTFNKVWIVADQAEVFEHNQTAFVTKSHLKVMLESDYLAVQKNGDSHHFSTGDNKKNSDSHQIIREIILPEIEREVNTGKNFATLRQIFNSIILASWYKNNLKQSLLNEAYANKSNVKGIDIDASINHQIYNQYLQAYKKGVFNLIKEDSNDTPRKYFSGGINPAMAAHPARANNSSVLGDILSRIAARIHHVAARFDTIKALKLPKKFRELRTRKEILKALEGPYLKFSFTVPDVEGNVQQVDRYVTWFKPGYGDSLVDLLQYYTTANVTDDARKLAQNALTSLKKLLEQLPQLPDPAVNLPLTSRPDRASVAISDIDRKKVEKSLSQPLGILLPGNRGRILQNGLRDVSDRTTIFANADGSIDVSLYGDWNRNERQQTGGIFTTPNPDFYPNQVKRDNILAAVGAYEKAIVSEGFVIESFTNYGNNDSGLPYDLYHLRLRAANQANAAMSAEKTNFLFVQKIQARLKEINAALDALKGQEELTHSAAFQQRIATLSFVKAGLDKLTKSLLLTEKDMGRFIVETSSDIKTLEHIAQNPSQFPYWDKGKVFSSMIYHTALLNEYKALQQRATVSEEEEPVHQMVAGGEAAQQYDAAMNASLKSLMKDIPAADKKSAAEALKVAFEDYKDRRIKETIYPDVDYSFINIKNVIEALGNFAHVINIYVNQQVIAVVVQGNKAHIKIKDNNDVDTILRLIERLIDQSNQEIQAGYETADRAMTNGGIDLKDANAITKVNKQGAGVEFKMDPAMAARIKAEGIDQLTPVILNVEPVNNVWPLFGLPTPISK